MDESLITTEKWEEEEKKVISYSSIEQEDVDESKPLQILANGPFNEVIFQRLKNCENQIRELFIKAETNEKIKNEGIQKLKFQLNNLHTLVNQQMKRKK